MPVPRTFNDGSFTNAIQQGAAKWTYPFFDRGDSTSFEYTETLWQDQATYNRLPVGSPLVVSRPGSGSTTCYLVDESPTQAVANGLLEFHRTWASIPITRNEGGSMVWQMDPSTACYIYGSRYDLFVSSLYYQGAQTPYTISWRYEYFNFKPYPLVVPRVEFFTFNYSGWMVVTSNSTSAAAPPQQQTTQYGIFIGIRTYPHPLTEVPGQASDVNIYKGNLYVRKTPIIPLLFTG